MAQMSVGKAFLIDHDWTTSSHIGKIYAASVQNGQLMQKVYILNDEYNKKIINNILAGIYNKVSVGFGVDLNYMVCDSCGMKSYYDDSCPHMVGGMDEKGAVTTITIKDTSDYFEVSIVPVPAQRDAGIRRSMAKTASETLKPTKSVSVEEIKELANPFIPTLVLDAKQLKLEKDLTIESKEENEEEIKTSDTINIDKSTLGEPVVAKKEEKSVEAETEAKAEVIAEAAAKTVTAEDIATQASTEEDAKSVEAKDEEDMKAKEDEAKALPKDAVEEDAMKATVAKLAKIAASHKKANKQTKKAVKTLLAANEERGKQLELQIKEQSERLTLLCQIVEAAMSQSIESVIQDSQMKAGGAKSAGSSEWLKKLNNNFLAGGQ